MMLSWWLRQLILKNVINSLWLLKIKSFPKICIVIRKLTNLLLYRFILKQHHIANNGSPFRLKCNIPSRSHYNVSRAKQTFLFKSKQKNSTKCKESSYPATKNTHDVNVVKSRDTVFTEHRIKSRLLYNSLLHLHSHTDRLNFQRKINTDLISITQPFACLNPIKIIL